MSLTFIKTFTAVHIGPTQYCMETIEGGFLGPTIIVLLVNDALIYLAVAYKVYTTFRDNSDVFRSHDLTLLISSPALSILSKVLLLNSQRYCLMVVFSKAFLVLAVLDFDGPACTMFIICHLVLVNILSSRVYRDIRMPPAVHHEPTSVNGIWADEAVRTGTITGMDFAEMARRVESRDKVRDGGPSRPESTGSEAAAHSIALNRTPGNDLVLEIHSLSQEDNNHNRAFETEKTVVVDS
ncbi:hypothetical protein M413DRAFT_25884 [Hebeloma cylindrosporum]|uniref:Transmembrane protein n=1 Tax=Hebeloma cylindrosporum TaxID=76867 RepID=A0A0C3CIQ8_HEBCY|nr:hypothetical protein M413DRAFT_25884 [Hebeloma cylindrosporum h7]